jgi:hypothetical protein
MPQLPAFKRHDPTATDLRVLDAQEKMQARLLFSFHL